MPTAEQARGSAPIAAAGAVYLLFIGYQSLAGAWPAACQLPLLQQGRHLSFSDGIANLIAYVPLGLRAAAGAGGRRGRARPSTATLVAGFLAISAFSLAMETAQACLPGRVSSWYDWATNSSGAAVGLVLWALGRRAVRAAARQPVLAPAARSPLLLPALLCLGAWLAVCTAPWRFTLDVGSVRANLAFLRHLSGGVDLDAWRLARHFAAWLATGVALRALWPARRTALLALILLSGLTVLAQVLLVVPRLSVEKLAGMAGAALVMVLVGRGASGRGLARLLSWLALACVVAYQLAPQAGGRYASGFEWWPQLGRGGLLGALELAMLYCWLAFALVLSLRWSAGLGMPLRRRPFLVPLAVAGALLLTEFAQYRVPGRTPDTSAPLVTLLAFAVAWALTGHGAQRPSASHIASTRRRTRSSIAMGRPHSRDVSPGHLLVASRPSLDPRPDTGEAKSR